MRSASLFAVAVLAVILAASLLGPAAAQNGDIQATIHMNKVTTNGDKTTIFNFVVFRDGTKEFEESMIMGGVWEMQFTYPSPIVITIQEIVPNGWYISDIRCVAGLPQTTFELSGVKQTAIITFQASDVVTCTFTNSPVGAVGGVVMPTNTFALVSPWLAVIGLVGCIGTVVVVTKKR
jgi:hypothetical protein